MQLFAASAAPGKGCTRGRVNPGRAESLLSRRLGSEDRAGVAITVAKVLGGEARSKRGIAAVSGWGVIKSVRTEPSSQAGNPTGALLASRACHSAAAGKQDRGGTPQRASLCILLITRAVGRIVDRRKRGVRGPDGRVGDPALLGGAVAPEPAGHRGEEDDRAEHVYDEHEGEENSHVGLEFQVGKHPETHADRER